VTARGDRKSAGRRLLWLGTLCSEYGVSVRTKSRVEYRVPTRIKGGSVKRRALNPFDRWINEHKQISTAVFVVVVFGAIALVTYWPF
jgi:hypothetical protein